VYNIDLTPPCPDRDSLMISRPTPIHPRLTPLSSRSRRFPSAFPDDGLAHFGPILGRDDKDHPEEGHLSRASSSPAGPLRVRLQPVLPLAFCQRLRLTNSERQQRKTAESASEVRRLRACPKEVAMNRTALSSFEPVGHRHTRW
jgi:hypothetical protein